MAQPASSSVNDYLAAQPPAAQRVLRRVRTVVRKAIPEATEVLAYKIPTYKLPGGTVLHFAGWKDHLSLYPASEGVVAAIRQARAKVEVEKGTVRIPYDATLPVHLISLIARVRAQEVAAGVQRTKKAAPSTAKTSRKKPATKKQVAKKQVAKKQAAKKQAAKKR